MKTEYIVLVFTLFFVYSAIGQDFTSSQEVRTYSPSSETGKGIVEVKMAFGSDEVFNPNEIELPKGAVIERVELIYTSMKAVADFSQSRLNQKRLLKLHTLFPELKTQELIEWKTIVQNEWERGVATDLFHGFRIVYRQPWSEAVLRDELSYLDDLLQGTTTSLIPVPLADEEKEPDLVFEDGTEKLDVRSRRLRKREKTLEALVELADDEMTFALKSDSIVPMKKELSATTTFYLVGRSSAASIQDSTVLKVFDRNKNKWKNKLVVHDVTGSMYAYTGQVLLWHKLNLATNSTVGYVFFNDGNATPDNKKVTGSVGGIYLTEGKTFEEVEETARQAMSAGGGGDTPENNLEAALSGQNKFAEAEAIVLIADNYATPRDLKLAHSIKKPLHIVLCGAHHRINVSYLNLALETGGTIHTVEEDLEDLSTYTNGKMIEVSGQKFKVKNGKFVRA